MAFTRTKDCVNGVALGLALLAASGCASNDEELGGGSATSDNRHTAQGDGNWWVNLINHAKWKQIQRPDDVQVEQISLAHPIVFDYGRTELDPRELARLRSFVAEGGISAGDLIEVDGPRDVSGLHSPLTSARLDTIRRELASIGLPAHIAARPGAFDPASESVTMTVNRYLVIPPDCYRPPKTNKVRREDDVGCATMGALGLMVARPQDLHHGRPLGADDGTTSAKSIQRLREGDEEELEETETTNQ